MGHFLFANRFLVIVCGALLLGACAETPKPMPEIAAVRIQNEETKKRIDNFSERNERAIAQSKKASDAQKKETEAITKTSSSLETARKILTHLLNE